MYQKTNAVSEIKRVGKDSFWAKAEVSVAGEAGTTAGGQRAVVVAGAGQRPSQGAPGAGVPASAEALGVRLPRVREGRAG